MRTRDCPTGHVEELEWTFKALAYRKRLEILRLLITSGPMSVGRIGDSLKMPVNTVSRNLAPLARAGLLSSQQTSSYVVYSVKRMGLSTRNRILLELVGDASKASEKRELLNAVALDLAAGSYRNTGRILRRLGCL